MEYTKLPQQPNQQQIASFIEFDNIVHQSQMFQTAVIYQEQRYPAKTARWLEVEFQNYTRNINESEFVTPSEKVRDKTNDLFFWQVESAHIVPGMQTQRELLSWQKQTNAHVCFMRSSFDF